MKNKSGFKNVLIVFGLILVSIGLILYFSFKKEEPEENIPLPSGYEIIQEPENTAEKQESPTPLLKQSPEEYFNNIIKNFLIAWAKASSNDKEADKAFDLLSENAKKTLIAPEQSKFAALNQFAGVSDAPQNFNIEEVFEEKGTTDVEVSLKYHSGLIKKTFHFVFENENWKIDLIK